MAENNPFPGENNTGHIWDDNLRELKNPPPRWWMIAFWASILWWIGYGLIYPMWPMPYQPKEGEGYTKGLTGWTAIKEYDEGVAQVQERRKVYEDKIATMSPDEILKDPGLTQYTLASAKVLFGDNCSACHGSGGMGNPGFPVLADDDWLYGGTTAKITETITGGRQGSMTAWGSILKPEEIDALTQWVVQMSDTGGEGGSKEGWDLYNAKGCSGCHGPKADGALVRGPDGSVLVTVGAANLTDSIFRFRPTGVPEDQELTDEQKYESAKYTISHGVNQPGVEGTREAIMPIFGPDQSRGGVAQLDPQSIKKLAVYVHQLGGGQ